MPHPGVNRLMPHPVYYIEVLCNKPMQSAVFAVRTHARTHTHTHVHIIAFLSTGWVFGHLFDARRHM